MRDAKTRTAAVDRTVAYLLDGVAAVPGEALDRAFAEWFTASSRFLAFAEAHRDKIRKKLRTASAPGARSDVRAELETAFLLLSDRRIELAFEAYGTGRRGPDFTVTFRASHRFNLEVTRPRPRGGDADPAGSIAQAVLAKLRQLPAETPNAVLVATGLAASAEEPAAAMRMLKRRSEQRDERFFSARGLSAGEFQVAYRRMAVLLVASAFGPGVHIWTNPEARRPLPRGAAAACLSALANATWAVESRTEPRVQTATP